MFQNNKWGFKTVKSPQSYNDGKWHHVAATMDWQNLVLYVDGNAVGSIAASANQSNNGYWKVGGDNLTSWPNQPTAINFTGYLDEAAIYTRALSAADIKSHFTAGSNSTIG
jgi:hypothetical protein